MSPDEWIEMVEWLDEQDVALTVDVAARFGAAWRRHDASQLRSVLTSLIGARVPITLGAVRSEMHRRSSRWIPLLEARHRELFADGCPNARCDLCLDIRHTV